MVDKLPVHLVRITQLAAHQETEEILVLQRQAQPKQALHQMAIAEQALTHLPPPVIQALRLIMVEVLLAKASNQRPQILMAALALVRRVLPIRLVRHQIMDLVVLLLDRIHQPRRTQVSLVLHVHQDRQMLLVLHQIMEVVLLRDKISRPHLVRMVALPVAVRVPRDRLIQIVSHQVMGVFPIQAVLKAKVQVEQVVQVQSQMDQLLIHPVMEEVLVQADKDRGRSQI